MKLTADNLRTIADSLDKLQTFGDVQISSFSVAGHTVQVERKDDKNQTTYYVRDITPELSTKR